MNAIDQYKYVPKHFTRSRWFGIYPLNDEGTEIYYGPESLTCVRYLSKINPLVIKKVFGEEYKTTLTRENESIDGGQETKVESQIEVKPTLTEPNLKTREVIVAKEAKINKKKELMDKNSQNMHQHRPQLSNITSPKYIIEKKPKGIFGYNQTESSPQKMYNRLPSTVVPTIRNRSLNRTFKEITSNFNKSVKSNQEEIDRSRLRTTKIGRRNQLSLKTIKLRELGNRLRGILTIRNIKIGKSREMGKKYFPDSHQLCFGDKVGRNFVGGLFQH